MNSNWSYSPETVKLGVDLCDLDLWTLTLTFCMDVTFVIGNNSWKFHDDTIMGTWWKRCDRRTDRRTDGQTDGLNQSYSCLVAAKNWQSVDFLKNYLSKKKFRLRHITPRHRCQLSIIRFVPKYLDQTLVNFSPSPARDWQTGCLWWEVVESRFQLDLKSNFALKINYMEFLLGPITRRINVLHESWMKWTWHH